MTAAVLQDDECQEQIQANNLFQMVNQGTAQILLGFVQNNSFNKSLWGSKRNDIVKRCHYFWQTNFIVSEDDEYLQMPAKISILQFAEVTMPIWLTLDMSPSLNK